MENLTFKALFFRLYDRKIAEGSITFSQIGMSKNDTELMQELARLQSQLAANNIGPAQQKALVKSLMPMMKGPQRQRLQRILNMLGE